jgi:hypothetical protein
LIVFPNLIEKFQPFGRSRRVNVVCHASAIKAEVVRASQKKIATDEVQQTVLNRQEFQSGRKVILLFKPSRRFNFGWQVASRSEGGKDIVHACAIRLEGSKLSCRFLVEGVFQK